MFEFKGEYEVTIWLQPRLQASSPCQIHELGWSLASLHPPVKLPDIPIENVCAVMTETCPKTISANIISPLPKSLQYEGERHPKDHARKHHITVAQAITT